MAVYENGMIYVCTREPYRENSILVGCTPRLEQARDLHGLPDVNAWQPGDPVEITGPYPPGVMTARRLWYSQVDGEPLRQIVECPIFGAWEGDGIRRDLGAEARP